MSKKLTMLAAALTSAAALSGVSIELDPIFQNHMILQRGVTIPLHGRTAPEALVEVEFGDFRGRAVAAADGSFTVRLPELPAAGGRDLTVKCNGAGLTLQDVAVGDIYLAAGQSNMEFKLQNAKPGMESLTPADYRGIRYYQVPLHKFYGRHRNPGGNWQLLTAENSGNISACAFFFARELHRGTGVPVGIVEAAVGGTNIESWLSREALLADPDYREEVLAYDRLVSGAGAADAAGKLPKENDKLLTGIAAMFPAEPDDSRAAAGFEKPDFDDRRWETMRLPDSWTQGGHNHAGIFWYRREIEVPAADAGKPAELHLGAVDKADKVYFNGVLIGQTGDSRVLDTWNQLRVYPVPGKLVQSGRNQLTVRAASMVSIATDGGLLGPEREMYLRTGSSTIPLAGVWRYCQTFDAGIKGMTFMRTFGAGSAASMHMLYDNMLAPLAGFPLRGVLWYQGEANAICMARTYRQLLKAFIAERRRENGTANTDFLIVQLPEYNPAHYFAPCSQWALIREAQQQAATECDAHCIVTLGCGDTWEIHPVNKLAVGRACARAALALIKGEKVPAGPAFRTLRAGQGSLIAEFAPEGAALPPAGTKISGFAIAGADGRAFAARAAVTGKYTLEISAPEVKTPVMLWYAWGDHPAAAELRSADGIPASPFRAALPGTSPVRTMNLIHEPAAK